MKILIISHRIPWPLNEGGTIGIYNILKGYAQQGHDITMLSLSAVKHRIDLDEAGRELGKLCKFEFVPINTDIRPVNAFFNLFSNRSYNVERFYSKAFEQLLQNHLKNNTYDLIQVEGTYAAPYTDTILKYRSGKVILRQHNVEFQIWERIASNTGNPLKKWYLNLLARRLKKFERDHLNVYDAVVPVTADDVERFREIGCTAPTHVMPAGIDTDLWSPGNGKSDPLKLYHIGSLEWLPNVDAVDWFLETVWPVIHAENKSVTFHIAGKGMPEEMKSRVIDGVIMAGEVKDAVEFVSDKGICIVPLRSGSGIRLKILEAMSAGKPVISTTIGAQGIDYTDGENILIGDDPKTIAHQVLNLVNNDEIYSKISLNGRSLIESKYSIEAVTKRLIDFTAYL